MVRMMKLEVKVSICVCRFSVHSGSKHTRKFAIIKIFVSYDWCKYYGDIIVKMTYCLVFCVRGYV